MDRVHSALNSLGTVVDRWSIRFRVPSSQVHPFQSSPPRAFCSCWYILRGSHEQRHVLLHLSQALFASALLCRLKALVAAADAALVPALRVVRASL